MAFLRCVLAYCVTAGILFGDLLMPIAFATMFQNRLGAPFWQVLVPASAISAIAASSVMCRRYSWDDKYKAPLFISFWMIISVLSVGAYAEGLRFRELRAFAPDAYSWRPFIFSAHETPRDLQLYYHAAALKDCKPYAWSYRKMAFFELSPNIAVNVFPDAWIKRCTIQRVR